MDPETVAILASVCGGVLGWALGGLLDVFVVKVNIGKSKTLLMLIAAAMLVLIVALRFGL